MDPYRRARKAVAARDGAITPTTTEGLRHACRAVQTAHRLYKDADDTLETVCGPNKSHSIAISLDEESRHKAADHAQRAQRCFNECLKLLQPHWDPLK
ncbi:hypothetical protein BV20DRAFT_962300 [Pilatotrama ljubarskyi]|nr:hypothetical protein BV20DRAFT_962300 [Pilatotrama ljubarskyi]